MFRHSISKNVPSILILPNELLLMIASYLDCKDISHLLATNRRLVSLLTSTLYDELFKGGWRDSTLTILWNASRLGYDNVVRLFLDRGVPMTLKTTGGATLLHLAAQAGHAGVIRVLMSQNPEVVKYATSVRNNSSQAPIQIAVLNGRAEAVKALLEGGADPNITSRPDLKGVIPLHLAAEMGQEEIVSLLLKHGVEADIKTKDRFEKTPLHLILLSSCDLVMYRPDWGSPEGIVRELLANGADVSATDSSGKTALHWLCSTEKRWVPSISISTGKGRRRAKALYKTLATILLENGADINVGDRDGKTPLHFAARSKKAYMIRVLVELGADVNALDVMGETPLHLVMGKDNFNKTLKATKILLEHGADRGIKAIDGCTALDTAVKNHGFRFRGKKLVGLL